MANRRVKCRFCKEMIDSLGAFSSPVNVGFYYCNEEEYNAYMNEREKKKAASERAKERIHKIDPVYEAVAEILGYRTQHSIFFNEMKLWRGICNDETILSYLAENKSFLESTMQKDFDNEYKKIKYFSAILKNNLGNYKINYKPAPMPIQVKVDDTMYEPVVTRRKRRRSLSELEDEV